MFHRMPLVLLGSLLLATAAVAQEKSATLTPTPAPEKGYKLYGWLQAGLTANFDSPADRINFGVNFNWRSNDYRLNQLCFVLENPLEHENRFNLGYRVDFLVGHDAPFFAANGLFDRFTGLDSTSGVGLEGPSSFRNVNRIGIDLTQFYVDLFFPRFITERGIDVRIGKFYTLMGREVYPAPDTDFYSRTYENIVGTPFTHTGVLATVHATETLDVVAGVVEGWDVFEDNNGRPSYQAALIWNSPDKRYNWTTVAINGPEQPGNDHDDRTLVTSYLTVKLGSDEKWLLSTGGNVGHEANAASNATGRLKDAEWYACSAHLFYTVDPRLRLGLRAEWFRDDDGARTAVLKRPGFAASFYDVTFGVTYSLRKKLRVRPEIRLDWTPDARPFNDQTDKSQVTAAFDVVWKF
jgi:Putative beta-barrel porin-2, OmpL-like. bbp2